MGKLSENKILIYILCIVVFIVCLWLIVSGQRIIGSAMGLGRMLVGLAGLLGLLYLYNKPFTK